MLMPLASFHVSSWLYQCMTFTIGYIDSRARSSEEHRAPQGNAVSFYLSGYDGFLFTWKLFCAFEKEMKGVQFYPRMSSLETMRVPQELERSWRRNVNKRTESYIKLRSPSFCAWFTNKYQWNGN